MKRIEKPAGRYNIEVTTVDRPEPGSTEVIVAAEHSLISRGTELWRRYAREEPIDHAMMGYSLAGRIVSVGEHVTNYAIGDRVATNAPHAAFGTIEAEDPKGPDELIRIPDGLPSAHATFWPLATSAVLWIRECGLEPGIDVVIQGQGLVGSGCLQVARADAGARAIALDGLLLRCAVADRLGADAVINVETTDPVAAVMELTDGGADVVIEAVGGPAGPGAFEDAQRMVDHGGLIQVLGLYEDEPLPLDSGTIQGRRLVGGYTNPEDRPDAGVHAMELLADGAIQVDEMLTHRFPATDAARAFALLHERPGEALGVVLEWNDGD